MYVVNSSFNHVRIPKVSTCEHLTLVTSCCSVFDWPFEMEAIRSCQKDVKTIEKLSLLEVVRRVVL